MSIMVNLILVYITTSKFLDMINKQNNKYSSLIGINKDESVTKFVDVAPKFIIRLLHKDQWTTVELNSDSRRYIHIFFMNRIRVWDKNGKSKSTTKMYRLTRCTEEDF